MSFNTENWHIFVLFLITLIVLNKTLKLVGTKIIYVKIDVLGFAETSPSSPLPKCPKDVGDDDVFMVIYLNLLKLLIKYWFCFNFQTLNLPQEPQDSRSSSDSSTKGSDHHRIHYYLHDKPLEPRQPTYEPSKGDYLFVHILNPGFQLRVRNSLHGTSFC